MIAYIDMYRDQFGVDPICSVLGQAEGGFITSRGDRYGNVLAETVNGLYKEELAHARPAWSSATEVEFATMNWVQWWNHQRLHRALAYQTPIEVEQAYHRTRESRPALT